MPSPDFSSLSRPIQPMPDFVWEALEGRGLFPAYRSRPPYQQNDYLGWINRAKRPATKMKRLEQMLDELERGDVYMNMPHRPFPQPGPDPMIAENTPRKNNLDRLQEGNLRFARGAGSHTGSSAQARRAELVHGQAPFAIILGCSDSRVPVEIVFDQGIGDLFVIRVAGNIVAPSQLASAEFAAEKFGTRLVVVLGHSGCGAVQATLQELRLPPGERTENLRSLVERIRPSVEAVLESAGKTDEAELVGLGVIANVRLAVEMLRSESAVLKRLIDKDGLQVVGAVYDLSTGLVEFLEETKE